MRCPRGRTIAAGLALRPLRRKPNLARLAGERRRRLQLRPLSHLHGSAGRADEAGGAVSLMVVLMVPVSVFAAVTAMALPQRLAAESSIQEATADIAELAAAWRDIQGCDDEPLEAFFGNCHNTDPQADCGRPRETADGDAASALSEDLAAEKLRPLCDALSNAVLRDLYGHGFDPGTLHGFYSGSYRTASGPPRYASTDDVCLSQSSCIKRPWALPCNTGNLTKVTEAVHVGVAAHWNGPGWAAAQALPSGVPMGAESVGRVRRLVPEGEGLTELEDKLPQCGTLLNLVPQRLMLNVPDRDFIEVLLDAQRRLESNSEEDLEVFWQDAERRRVEAQKLAESVPVRIPFSD